MSPLLIVVLSSALLGLLVGSFLNVVIHRVPAGLSVVSPRSRCPGCESLIASRDNVPVLSWLLLRARCRHCRQPISARYPLIEVLTAVVFGLLAWRLGLSAELPAYLYLAGIGVALAAIDLDVKRLPNAIVLPSYPVAVVLLGAAALVEGSPWSLARGVLAGVVLFVVYLLPALLVPGGMGFGDVKLAGVLGIFLGFLGWPQVLVGTFLGFLFGGVAGVALMLGAGAGRKHKLPFGPFMLAGALTAICAGAPLWDAYVGVVALR